MNFDFFVIFVYFLLFYFGSRNDDMFGAILRNDVDSFVFLLLVLLLFLLAILKMLTLKRNRISGKIYLETKKILKHFFFLLEHKIERETKMKRKTSRNNVEEEKKI